MHDTIEANAAEFFGCVDPRFASGAVVVVATRVRGHARIGR
jgi:hypothetical protein